MGSLRPQFLLWVSVLLLFESSSSFGAKPKEKPSPATTSPIAANSPTPQTMALMPEVLGAKAYLEELLVRRYGQELATQLDRSSFTLGVQLELIFTPEAPAPQDDDTIPPDIYMGTLDPEDLLKKFGGVEGSSQVQLFLKNYRISSVNVSAGLKDNLPPEMKGKVETWLKARLLKEFGKVGNGVVSVINTPAEAPKPIAPPKHLLDWLNQFQELAGQSVIALAILLGALVWGIFSTRQHHEKSGETDAHSAASGGGGSGAGAGGGGGDGKGSGAGAGVGDPKKETPEERETRIQALKELKDVGTQIIDLRTRFTANLEQLVRFWTQSGDDGRMKLACFAETVGKDMGKLPIPPDALPDLSSVFTKMHSVPYKEKLSILRKVYWDLLTLINLGPSALEPPFGYMESLSVGMVNQVLMDQNPKLQALVSLYMSSDLRSRYMSSLPLDIKRRLILTVAGMTEIGLEELSSMDGYVKGLLRPSSTTSISLAQGLNKLVPTLTVTEEIVILDALKGISFDPFKKSYPSLAFLSSWKDESLALLLSKALPDEVTAYLRLRPEMADRILGLSPPMVVEVTADELSRPDNINDSEKNRVLTNLQEKLRQMIESKEIDLSNVIIDSPSDSATDEPEEVFEQEDDASQVDIQVTKEITRAA